MKRRRRRHKYVLKEQHQKSRIVCPAVVAVHTDPNAHSVTGQSSTFARPVVLRLHWQSFPIAQWLFPIALSVVSDCSVTLSDCSRSRFRLLSNFFRLLWQSFPIAQQLFPIALAVVSDCSCSRFRLLNKLFYMLIHLNLTTTR